MHWVLYRLEQEYSQIKLFKSLNTIKFINWKMQVTHCFLTTLNLRSWMQLRTFFCFIFFSLGGICLCFAARAYCAPVCFILHYSKTFMVIYLPQEFRTLLHSKHITCPHIPGALHSLNIWKGLWPVVECFVKLLNYFPITTNLFSAIYESENTSCTKRLRQTTHIKYNACLAQWTMIILDFSINYNWSRSVLKTKQSVQAR